MESRRVKIVEGEEVGEVACEWGMGKEGPQGRKRG